MMKIQEVWILYDLYYSLFTKKTLKCQLNLPLRITIKDFIFLKMNAISFCLQNKLRLTFRLVRLLHSTENNRSIVFLCHIYSES